MCSKRIADGVSYRQETLDDNGYPPDEGSTTIADIGLDGAVRRLAGLGQPLILRAEIIQCCPLEASPTNWCRNGMMLSGTVINTVSSAAKDIRNAAGFGEEPSPGV